MFGTCEVISFNRRDCLPHAGTRSHSFHIKDPNIHVPRCITNKNTIIYLFVSLFNSLLFPPPPSVIFPSVTNLAGHTAKHSKWSHRSQVDNNEPNLIGNRRKGNQGKTQTCPSLAFKSTFFLSISSQMNSMRCPYPSSTDTNEPVYDQQNVQSKPSQHVSLCQRPLLCLSCLLRQLLGWR